MADARALERALAVDGALEDVEFSGAFAWPQSLNDRRFIDCRFVDTVFGSIDLEGTVFSGCTFERASLRGANLRESSFQTCVFFVDDAAADFRYAELRDARFVGCDLTTVTFERANAHGLSLLRCQAQGADFSLLDVGLAIGRNNTRFAFEASDCNLAYADFTGVTLTGTTLRDCRLAHAVLHRVDLTEADLSGSDLTNIESNALTLVGADLRGARFNNLDPRTVDLSGARVSVEQALVLLDALGIVVEDA
ncbi:MAG: pentapeptide repeat-containing protein [Pseudomonadota bacterium]